LRRIKALFTLAILSATSLTNRPEMSLWPYWPYDLYRTTAEWRSTLSCNRRLNASLSYTTASSSCA